MTNLVINDLSKKAQAFLHKPEVIAMFGPQGQKYLRQNALAGFDQVEYKATKLTTGKLQEIWTQTDNDKVEEGISSLENARLPLGANGVIYALELQFAEDAGASDAGEVRFLRDLSGKLKSIAEDGGADVYNYEHSIPAEFLNGTVIMKINDNTVLKEPVMNFFPELPSDTQGNNIVALGQPIPWAEGEDIFVQLRLPHNFPNANSWVKLIVRTRQARRA